MTSLEDAILAHSFIDEATITPNQAIPVLLSTKNVEVRFFLVNWVYRVCRWRGTGSGGADSELRSFLTPPLLYDLLLRVGDKSSFQRLCCCAPHLGIDGLTGLCQQMVTGGATGVQLSTWLCCIATEVVDANLTNMLAPLFAPVLPLLEQVNQVEVTHAWLRAGLTPSETLLRGLIANHADEALADMVGPSVCPPLLVQYLVECSIITTHWCHLLASSLSRWTNSIPFALWERLLLLLAQYPSPLLPSLQCAGAPLARLGVDAVARALLNHAPSKEAAPVFARLFGMVGPKSYFGFLMESLQHNNNRNQTIVGRVYRAAMIQCTDNVDCAPGKM
jgi:hypothetical protein